MNNMKIAEVIISSQVKSLDKTYHYLTDLDLLEGTRVQVPFGRGNRKTIGYFTGFVGHSEYQDLKQIIKAVDEKPLVTPDGIALARYVRKTCLCSMSEALRLLLPPNVNLKMEQRVGLVSAQWRSEQLTPLQTKVMEVLEAAAGEVELRKLLEAAEVKSSSVVRSLEKKKLLRVEEYMVGAAKEKTRRFVTLAVEESRLSEALADLNGAKVAAQALEIVAEHGSLPLRDLLEMAKCGVSSVEVLEKRGMVEIDTREVLRSPIRQGIKRTVKFDPTEEQKAVLNKISELLKNRTADNLLLHGVTGSGKTEVFLQAAQQCMQMDRNVIILVPEIALTPQMVERFVSRFGDEVALLHSGLSMGERYDQWRRIREGRVKLVVGARSAVFAPFDNIGLIVVDEEHENSYRSEATPRYNAVDVALFRGKQNNGVVLLASATPSVEDYYKAQNEKYRLMTLENRHNLQRLPEVELVDMTKELAAGNKSVLSRRMTEELYQNLLRGEQTILFLNRRGYSTFVSCRSCGYVAKCPHCSISLTYHAKRQRLVCHYCGYQTQNPEVCPECGSLYIRYFGTGTQRVEEDLQRVFPGISVLRMDADTTKRKLSHQMMFDKFKKENISVLLGTQMVTKGLDFPSVTLVGVLSADSLLNLDDYRANERTFAQLTQVCGRAGRGERSSRPIILLLRC